MGSGGVAIAALPTVICLKVPFSDGLGGVEAKHSFFPRIEYFCSRFAGIHPSLFDRHPRKD